MLGILERIGKIRYNDYEKLSSSLEIVLVWWKTSCTEKKNHCIISKFPGLALRANCGYHTIHEFI